MDAEGRNSRNELLFGAEGQARIAEARVGIVGLGGLGSHVAQQLAYLGVFDFVLVDHDTVSKSNLNRLIGATPKDVGVPKVEVAERLIGGVQPDARVQTIRHHLPAPAALDALADRTFLFGCVDRERPRLHLTDLASQYQIPYLDTATEVMPDGEYGGRLVLARGDGCLYCLGEIDQVELRREQMPPEQRRAHDAIYGIDADFLDGTGPSVVSLNGVAASLAVNEFMVWTTNLSTPARQLNYRARLRRLTRPISDTSDCPYCGRWESGGKPAV